MIVVAIPKRVMELPRALITDVDVTKVLRFPGRYAPLTRSMVVLRAGEAAGMAILVRDPELFAATLRMNHRPGAAGTS